MRAEPCSLKRAVAAFLILLLLAFAGCAGTNPAYHKYEYEFFGTFDTVIQIVGYTKTEAEFNGWAKKAEARFVELNRLYDMYNVYPGVSNIKTINDNAGKRPVQVSSEIIDLIRFSKDWNEKCPGVINIALGSVLSIWHDYREKGLADPANAALPPMNSLQAASAHTDIDKVLIDAGKGTVYLEDGAMSLDVGSVAKGYATEIVAQELNKQGFNSFIINSGGNVRAVGAPLDGVRKKWGVGITDPDNPGDEMKAGALMDTAFVADMAVTTAGDYQRYYTVGGKRYSHIIDPNTLMPATTFRAVTVAAKDSGVSDFLDTLLFILPYDKGLALVKSLGNVEALWVFPDGTLKATDGMKAMLKGLGGATSK